MSRETLGRTAQAPAHPPLDGVQLRDLGENTWGGLCASVLRCACGAEHLTGSWPYPPTLQANPAMAVAMPCCGRRLYISVHAAVHEVPA